MEPRSAKPPHNPLFRNIRAACLIAFVVAVCYFAGGWLIHRVRDLRPEEIRGRMASDALPLDTAIEQLNKLNVRDRSDLMQSPEAQKYFQSLKPDQRLRFVRETMDRGIRQQIERFRNMKPDEKAAFIEEVKQRQEDMREQLRNTPEDKRAEMRQMIESTNMREIIEKAVNTYLSVTNSAERAELAPLFNGALENVNFAKGL
jgi:hypothetical protein